MPARLGQVFWGHITHFRSRVPPASCTGLGLLLLPERLIWARTGPTLSTPRHLSSGIPHPCLSNSTQAAETEGKAALVLGFPASHRLLSRLLKQVYVHAYSYISFRSSHEHTGCAHTRIQKHITLLVPEAGAGGTRQLPCSPAHCPVCPCTSDPGVSVTSAPPGRTLVLRFRSTFCEAEWIPTRRCRRCCGG